MQLDPTNKQVKKIVSEILAKEIINVKPIKRLVGDSVVFDISTREEQYIFRTGGIRANYDVEHKILKLVEKKGVKVPEPIAENIDLTKCPFTYSLQRKIQGSDLFKVTENLWPSILQEVGAQLTLVHSVKIDGCGTVDINKFRNSGFLIGTSNSWHEYLLKKFKAKMNRVDKKLNSEKRLGFKESKLSLVQRKKLLKIVRKTNEILKIGSSIKDRISFSEGCLLHGDIHFHHILVNKKKLVGILDFNKTYVGDPLFDIAYFSVMAHGELYGHLLKGSEVDFDEKLFHIYRLLIASGKIDTRYVQHNYLHEHPKILDIVLEELTYFK